MYTIDGVEYARKFGSREDVIAGTVYCTSGGLTKDQLEIRGKRIISKKRSALGKARYKKANPFVQQQVEEDDEKVEDKKSIEAPAAVVSASVVSKKPRIRKRRRRQGR